MGELFEMPLQDGKDRIFRLAQTGATDEDIAVELQIPLKRLQKRYRRELEKGRVKGKQEMLAQLYETASSGSNTTATMFWVKSKCGWRDTGASGDNVQIIRPILEITRRPLA